MIFSIDQNSNSLWDTLPKLQALARRGLAVTHLIEDIDVAFTSLGAGEGNLRVSLERFHPSGGSDWGAGLFYSEFLGRQPLELRNIEPQLGMKISTLARLLGKGLEELYQKFSTGDNWMLVGSSFVGDRLHHRLIGDLHMDECREHLWRIIDLAEQDCTQKFPASQSRLRTSRWFADERARLERLLEQSDTPLLIDLYRRWLGEYLPGQAIGLGLTSSLFSLTGPGERFSLLEIFLRDYDAAAALYNQAIDETGAGLHRLRISRGELPFFATMRHAGRFVRAQVSLVGNDLIIADRQFPLGTGRSLPIAKLQAAGIEALAGKAMILALQVRTGQAGGELALPHNGSAYMPASFALQKLLRSNNLLPPGQAEPKPVVRVRFRLLDRMKSLPDEAVIHLPEHLARAIGQAELPARELAEGYSTLKAAAQTRLRVFQRDSSARERWLGEAFSQKTRTAAELDARKRDLARANSKDPQLREISSQLREIRTSLHLSLLQQVVADTQTSQVDFWDSRGALLPWCVALGGQEFYDSVINRAEITPEQR